MQVSQKVSNELEVKLREAYLISNRHYNNNTIQSYLTHKNTFNTAYLQKR